MIVKLVQDIWMIVMVKKMTNFTTLWFNENILAWWEGLDPEKQNNIIESAYIKENNIVVC